MKTLCLVLCICVFILSPSLIAQNNEGKTAEKISADAQTIEKLVQSQISNGNFVGGSIAVVHHGKIIFAKTYGKRSLETNKPVEPETLFNIGSVSKQFTAAAIFLLSEDG
jgi:D-alanyl-D-alanine carboxypeptidase